MVDIFYPACELLPPLSKEIYLCTVAPLQYLLSDLLAPPPLSQRKCTVYTHYTDSCVAGVLNCTVDHILQEFYTLFLTRFRTYKLFYHPKQKWPVKTTLRDWCLYSSFVHASGARQARNRRACGISAALKFPDQHQRWQYGSYFVLLFIYMTVKLNDGTCFGRVIHSQKINRYRYRYF